MRPSANDPYLGFRFVLALKELDLVFGATYVESLLENKTSKSALVIERALKKGQESLGGILARCEKKMEAERDHLRNLTLYVYLPARDSRFEKTFEGRVLGKPGNPELPITVRRITVTWCQAFWLPLQLDANKDGLAVEQLRIIHPAYEDDGELEMKFSELTKGLL